MKILRSASCLAIILWAAVVPAKALEVMLPLDRNYTPLHEAAEHCDAVKTREALKALPRSGKSEAVNRLDREGYTPLGYAARAGCLEVVKLLMNEGASVDVAEEHGGWTPLLQAANQRHAEVVRYLLEHGANPKAKTRLGKTPLSVALAGSVFSFGPKGDRNATVRVLLGKWTDASPLLAAYDELDGVAHDQRQQIETLHEECQHLTVLSRKLQEERQQLENQLRRLEAECQRLNEIIEKIRSATGNPGYHPS